MPQGQVQMRVYWKEQDEMHHVTGRRNGSLMWSESKGRRVLIKIGNLLRFLIPSSYQVVSWIARPVAKVAGDIVDALGFGKYLRKDGRDSFQVDYGIAILNYACGRVWPDCMKPHPEWMHKSDVIPSDCKKCFICINNQQLASNTKSAK